MVTVSPEESVYDAGDSKAAAMPALGTSMARTAIAPAATAKCIEAFHTLVVSPMATRPQIIAMMSQTSGRGAPARYSTISAKVTAPAADAIRAGR